MWKIKKELLVQLLLAAERNYPKEFMCFLGGNQEKEIIEEFVFLPTEANEHSTSIYENSIPFDDTILGTIHSHPNSTNEYSKADKKVFSKYKINLILGYPFIIENVCAYDSKSKKIQVELI
jgi:proteasome lid subunit RPN8/RPN11